MSSHDKSIVHPDAVSSGRRRLCTVPRKHKVAFPGITERLDGGGRGCWMTLRIAST